MSLSALEPIKQQILTPAVEVATGQATVEQVHCKYKGKKLLCPHCALELSVKLGNDLIAEMRIGKEETAFLQTGIYTKDILEQIKRRDVETIITSRDLNDEVNAYPDDLHVLFRRGSMDQSNSTLRWMHWAHVSQRKGKNQKPPCYSPGCIDHAVAVGSIQYSLEEEYKADPYIKICREKDLIIIPGEPPLKRRPDLVVKGENDRVIVVWEIQRSPLGKADFMERTRHLLSTCRDVRWAFFKGTYARMGPQRQWLKEMGLTFYYIRFNGFRVVVEEGKPPAPKGKLIGSKSTKSDCQFHDDPIDLDNKPHRQERLLPLSVVGAAIMPTDFSQPPPEPEFKVGDEVEAWVEGKWLEAILSGRDLEGNLRVRLKRAINGKYYFSAYKIQRPQKSQLTLQSPSKPVQPEPEPQQISLFPI